MVLDGERPLMTDREYMDLAIAQARLAAQRDEVPVGAVLVKGDKVIASAHNLVETLGDATAHAEMLVLREGMRQLGWRLSDCTLYVSLEPCAMCAGAIVNARLGKLIFGAFDERFGCCGSRVDLVTDALIYTVLTVGGIAEAECAALLSAYFQGKRG